MIELKEINDEIKVSLYDDGDNVKHTKLEMEVCEDIYDVINYYLNGEEIEDTIDNITNTMLNQKEK